MINFLYSEQNVSFILIDKFVARLVRSAILVEDKIQKMRSYWVSKGVETVKIRDLIDIIDLIGINDFLFIKSFVLDRLKILLNRFNDIVKNIPANICL